MSNKIDFAHLHVHTEFSLLDGCSRIKELAQQTKDLGMNAIAITDHGSMFGVIDFYKACKNIDIKPILGCEVYVANKSLHDKTVDRENYYSHLVLLAETNEGYQNLMKLVSIGYTDGYYYRPRIDFETLAEHKEGIIALSACLAGVVSRKIMKHGYNEGLEIAKKYKELFGKEHFYIELQNHGMIEEIETNKHLINIAKELDLDLVCTNDVHYTYDSDVKSHEVLLCIQTGKTILDEDRLVYEGGGFYLKSPEEMYELFSANSEALSNTQKIADRCNVEIEFNNYKLPRFTPPDNLTSLEYLKQLTEKALYEKYEVVTDVLKDRLNFEINVISDMGFIDYFLIVWDFIKYARDNGIPVGPGRGSAAGSIVSYLLEITNIDPLKYDLLFERFLNPERVSMPDIDIDFCYQRREEVIRYVNDKYGVENVAQIVTFGTMGARQAIRDVGRALAIPLRNVDRVAKMIPTALGITIKKALEMNPDLNSAYEYEDETKELIDMAIRLEGLTRHTSIHAAGVIISDKKLDSYVPLYQSDGNITTQFTMGTLEELGLLKMDFLGLRTLTVIDEAVKEIKRSRNIDINIDKIDYNDAKVFELISHGYTEGVFQLESSGMKAFLKELKPDSLEEIIAGISLYRPGPMDFIPKYIKGKNSKENIEYTDQSLVPILEQTYGCIVYQEQVMRIFRELAGYSLGRSDLVRRAMSKKKMDVMEKERQIFIYGLEGEIDGCVNRGITPEKANIIFDEMSDFAKYAFNKSHAAAYAVVGYQTAWLKVHYNVEFMAAVMSSVMDSTTKVAEYIEDCKTNKIEVLQPDINESIGKFSVANGKIRFGLDAIKNVGRNTVRQMVEERETNGNFKSLQDFINRMENKDTNKRTLESLILVGAFDSLGGKRSQYYTVYQKLMNSVSSARKNNVSGQISLLDFFEDEVVATKDELPEMSEFDNKVLLQNEKERLGVYVTGHPLDEFKELLAQRVSITSKDLDYNEEEDSKLDNKRVIYGGIISKVVEKYTKNNDKMCFLNVEDYYGVVEVIVFPNMYRKFSEYIEMDTIILVEGTVNVIEFERAKILCNNIKSIDLENIDENNYNKDYNNNAINNNDSHDGRKLFIKISNSSQFTYVVEILEKYKGNTTVIMYNDENKTTHKLDNRYNVDFNENLANTLKKLLGNDSLVLK